MNYDWHVRWTNYLRRINNGATRPYSKADDLAAKALWDAEASEVARMGTVAWDHEADIKRKGKKAGT